MSARSAAIWWGLLLLLIAILLTLNYRYNAANSRPPTFDDAWYLETSLTFYHRLTTAGWLAFFDAYKQSFGIKAPLMSVLPLPFYRLVGPSYHAALMVNSAFLVLGSVYLFLLVRRLFGPGVALASVLFYETMPLAYALSRVFMVDYGLTALVIVFLYYLVASEGLTRGAANFALGILFGLGLLMKVLFPALVAGPIVVTVFARRRFKRQERRETFWLWRSCAERPLLAIAIPAVALAGTWYSFHLTAVLGFAWGAYGTLGDPYGEGGVRRWLLTLVNDAVSFYYLAGLLGLVGVVLVLRRKRDCPRLSMLFVLSWLVPPFLALAAGHNREIRLSAPLLPPVAICLAALVFELSERAVVRAGLVLLLAALPAAVLIAFSTPSIGGFHNRRLGPFVLLGPDLGWAHPPDSEGAWGQQRIIDALERLRFGQNGWRYAVVGVEHPYFNANLFSYLNAYRQYPFQFTSLGYAETSANAAIDRLYQLDPLFLIMAEGFPAYSLPEFLNRVNGDVQRRLDRGELPFRLREKIRLHSHITAAIYRREDPWSLTQRGSTAPKPSHPLSADAAPGIRFLGYDWAPKNHYLQELTCYWTVLRPVESDYRIHLEFRRGEHVVFRRDHAVADGQYSFQRWQPGDVVKESVSMHLADSGHGGPLEAAVWLLAPDQHSTGTPSNPVLLNLEE